MKRRKVMKKILLILITGITLVSCDNNNNDQFDVASDVYAINRIFDDEIRTALAYYAYADQSIMSASVALPGNGGNIELKDFPGSLYTMAKEPEDSEYKAISPAEGIYTFTVKSSNGVTIQQQDSLDYVHLAIPHFTKTNFAGIPVYLETEWNLIPGADSYNVKMFDLEGKLIFTSFIVGNNVNQYIITGSSASGYWTELVTENQQYLLQINAIVYDSDANSSNYVYNVSEISIGEKLITWGSN
jgi:hypothetical protein